MNYRSLSLGRQRALPPGRATAPSPRPTPLSCNDLFLAHWLRVRGASSNDEFAARLGLPVSTIGAIERGERRITSEHLDRLAHAAGVTVDALLRQVASRAQPQRRASPR